MADVKAHLIDLSDHVYQRTHDRLLGLTDAEYFWEPAPNCWTLRRTDSGGYRADRSDSAQPAPFTTIAWRLWHLIECYGSERNPRWLGVIRSPGGFERDDPAPGSASEGLAELERAHALWSDVLRTVPTESLWEPFGAAAGQYAEQQKIGLVLHQLDEQIHHGAELGLMRDLYEHHSTG